MPQEVREVIIMSSQRFDPFQNKASIKGRKQKRSQGSSHYRTKGPSELQALPQLKGEEYVQKIGYKGFNNNLCFV